MTESLLMVLAILLSAFFSGTETAFICARRITLEVWDRQGLSSAHRTLHLIGNPRQFLSTTLVGTNIGTVAASSLIAIYLQPYFHGLVITVISSVTLLLLGEIFPKEVARQRATRFALLATGPLRFFYYLLYPITWSVMNLATLILKLFGLSEDTVRKFFTREDLDILVREGEESGLVNEEERSMISRFILRGGYKVRDVMVPRTSMTVLKTKDSVKTAVQRFMKTGFSRLPIIDGHIDQISGMIYAKDLINQRPQALNEIIREALFIPESLVIGKCLRTMQTHEATLAIVVDEHGGTAGLVTIEDIIEEFFGEIEDEFDIEKEWFRSIKPGITDVNAKVELSLLNEKLKLDLKPGDYQTLGGYLIYRAGRIPRRNDTLSAGEAEFRILSCTRKQIRWVRINHEKTTLQGKIT